MRLRKILFVLVVIGVLGLAGCGKTEEPKAEEKNKVQEEKLEDETDVEEPEEEKSFAEEMLTRYLEIQESTGYELGISDELENSSDSSKINFKRKTSLGAITISKDENGNYKKSFRVMVSSGFDEQAFKELTTATLMVCDPELNQTDAKEQAQELAASFKGSASETYNVGEYAVYLSKSAMSNMEINAVHQEDNNQEVNTEDYKEFSYEEMKAELNKGELCKIAGTVTHDQAGEMVNAMRVAGDDGNDYIVYYNPSKFPDGIEIDKKYTLYGAIAAEDDGLATMRLEYYEVTE